MLAKLVQGRLLDKREEAIQVGVELPHEQVAVGFARDQVVLSEEVHEVHGVDFLALLAVDAAEGVKQHKLVLSGEHFALGLAVPQGQRVTRNDLSHDLLGFGRKSHFKY